ncbi:hypothetical protein [Alteribacter aurantiacus]|uniref:hypothetical protein n=1 Tax=Alteribacter aurantiacus TaxID=254410 RepID=UPI0012EC988B|nr:hypothetical protein [Alteribacter aurantiacus]
MYVPRIYPVFYSWPCPFWYYPLYRLPESSYPPVETSLFAQSLQESQALIEHGRTIVTHLAANEGKMYDLMTAAQAGNDDQVDQIVGSTGVPIDVETSYTPRSVTFRLRQSTATIPRCCTLTMNIVWTDY